MTIAGDGSFSGYIESQKGWAPRKVYGLFPELKIAALSPGTLLICADGQVRLSKR
jgi:hypothetical protein